MPPAQVAGTTATLVELKLEVELPDPGQIRPKVGWIQGQPETRLNQVMLKTKITINHVPYYCEMFFWMLCLKK